MNSANDVIQKLKEYEKSLVDEWTAQVEDPSDPLGLAVNGSLMELNKKTQKLTVNFSERLVELLREVRELLALGHKIKSGGVAQQACSTAQRFFRRRRLNG